MRASARVAAIALLGALGGPLAAQADDLHADLRIVTDVPDLEGRQAQSPVWGPGSVPRLVHQATDRDRQTLLRVVAIQDGEVHAYLVPGSRSSRLERLGSGDDRSDRAVSWWDATGFFFIRSAGEGADLHFFDGVPRAVPGATGRVSEVLADPARGRLFVATEVDGEVDVVRYDSTDLTAGGTRLTDGEGTVEHSLSVDRRGDLLHVVTTRDETRVATRPSSPDGRARSLGVPEHELLSAAPVGDGRAALLYARACSDASCHDSRHVLLEQPLDSGAARLLADRVQLPHGLAPKPAVSPDGRYVFFVADDPAGGSPVVRLDRTTGLTEAIRTGTRGNQEVAVAEYEGVLWLAVVAVGGVDETDVRNHLYMGPLVP